MLSFESDYTEGCHEQVLKKLCETNREQMSGYGSDPYTASAKEKILKACDCPTGEVFFLTGGTQTNQIVIDTMLQSFEGVIAAKTGHVSVHEAGAIESMGHKVLEIKEQNGKISAETLEEYLQIFWKDGNYEHMVFPGMVYISHPTEYGTLYTKAELNALSKICRQYEIPLFMDGARLGYGLCARKTDVDLPTIARLCDVFYIGGTKVGALCGEAVVFTHNNMPKHFLTQVKQHGALLAKGRLLGVQFDALFTENLYLRISQHAIDMAELLKDVLRQKNCQFYLESDTNQQFIILQNKELERLQSQVKFSFWDSLDQNRTVVRLATSWATKEEDIKRLAELW